MILRILLRRLRRIIRTLLATNHVDDGFRIRNVERNRILDIVTTVLDWGVVVVVVVVEVIGETRRYFTMVVILIG